MRLVQIIAALERLHGKPRPPRVTEPFAMILHEVVAYLVDDAKRERTWREFKRVVGAKAQAMDVLDADPGEVLAAIKGGGLFPEQRVEKLRKAARLCVDSFGGDLGPLVAGPVKKARSGLKKFRGVGEPGADRILLYARRVKCLALDSNALRVLLRLGYGSMEGGYAAQYRSVQEAVAQELKDDFEWLIGASQVLRKHGQEVCRRAGRCGVCPLAGKCAVKMIGA